MTTTESALEAQPQRSPRAGPKLFAVLAAILAFIGAFIGLLRETRGVRLATADDVAIYQALSDHAVGQANRIHDFRMGRFYADVKFDLLEGLMRNPSDQVQAAIRLIAFIGAVTAMAAFVTAGVGSVWAGLAAAIVAVSLVPVSIGYAALLSYPLLWFGWAAVWAMGVLALGPDSSVRRLAVALALTVALLVHEANAVFAVVPATVVVLHDRTWSARRLFGISGPSLVVLVVYAALFLLMWRAANATWPAPTYDGAQVSLKPVEAGYSMFAYTLSGLPSFDSWLLHSSAPHSALFLSPADWVRMIVWDTSGLGFAVAVICGTALWLLMRGAELSSPSVGAGRLVLLLLYIAFAANAMAAVTSKYQVWAHQRMWPYYYTGMSYLAWSALGAIGIWRIAQLRSGRAKFALQLGVVALAMLAIAAVSASNSAAASLLRRAPFDHMLSYKRFFPR